MLGKIEGKKEKRVAEDEMMFNGHDFQQTLVDSGGQRSLVCCSP